MLLFPNALCCSLYERNCVCAVTKIFTKFLPANNFCQLLRVTRKRSCTSAGNAQAQLHFRDDQQRGRLKLATSPINWSAIVLRSSAVTIGTKIGPVVPLTIRYSPSSEVQANSFTCTATNEPNLSSLFLLSKKVQNH